MSNRIYSGLSQYTGNIGSQNISTESSGSVESIFRSYNGNGTPSGKDNINNNSIIEKILISKGIVRDAEVGRLVDRSKHMIHDIYLHSNTAGPTRSYAFFVRPNMNLFRPGTSVNFDMDSMLSKLSTMRTGQGLSKVALNPDLAAYPPLLSAVTLNAELALELCRDACDGSGLIPILANHCTEIAPITLQSDDRDGVRNMYGKSMQLPGVFNFYDNQISVTFNDNRYGDISKLFYLIGMYKDHVVREGFKRDSKYIARNAIDWATSIYVMTVDQDNYLIGWTKYTGCVPKTLPLNLAQHKRAGFDEGELTSDVVIDFQVFKTNPFRISTLAEFNKISGFDLNRMIPLRCGIDSDPKPVTADLNTFSKDTITKTNSRGEAKIHDVSRSRFNAITSSRSYTQMAKFPGVIYDSEERRYRLVFSE